MMSRNGTRGVLCLWPCLCLGVSTVSGQTIGLYWSADGFVTGEGKVERSDLDGAHRTELVNTGLWGPWSLAVDVGGGKMYWGDVNRQVIERADLDGTNVSVFLSGPRSFIEDPAGMALDAAGGFLYWTDFYTKAISRTDLSSGQTVELIGYAGQLPLGIDLDTAGGWMYWIDSLPEGRIRRARLDGTNVTTVVAGLTNPTDVALDIRGGRMYWVSYDDGLLSAKLDGTDRQLLHPEGGKNLALDFVAQKIYWTRNGGISRINLDGTDLDLDIVPTGYPPIQAVNVIRDCNGNGVLDHEDVWSGTSQDCNGNGQPDECDPPCQTNSDCGDCNDCTIDTCNAGVCSHDWLGGCGACCNPFGGCSEVLANTCFGTELVYQGDGVSCQPDLCPRLIPAVGEWGLAAMLLASLCVGTIVFRRSGRKAVRTGHAA